MINYILIDGSYLIFYRYYALTKWWSIAKKDIPLFNIENNTLHVEFYEKFKKVFLECIKNIKKGLKLHKKNCKVILALDCSRDKIWRQEIYNDYKGLRVNQENDNIGNIFKFVYGNNLLEELKPDAILKHDKLEADDIISILKSEITNKYNIDMYSITIITGDHDYLQLIDSNTSIYDLKFKNLTDKKGVFSDPHKNLFYKIVLGDKSDNIKALFKRCTKQQVEDYYIDRKKFNDRLNQEKSTEQYRLNTTLIDFNCIPKMLRDDFIEKNKNVIDIL